MYIYRIDGHGYGIAYGDPWGDGSSAQSGDGNGWGCGYEGYINGNGAGDDHDRNGLIRDQDGLGEYDPSDR